MADTTSKENIDTVSEGSVGREDETLTDLDDDYEIEPLEIPSAISVSDLSNLMHTTPVEVIKEFIY